MPERAPVFLLCPVRILFCSDAALFHVPQDFYVPSDYKSGGTVISTSESLVCIIFSSSLSKFFYFFN